MHQPDWLEREIADAAFDDSAWQPLIARLSNELFSSAVGFEHHTQTEGVDPFTFFEKVDPDCYDALKAKFTTPESHIGIRALLEAPIGSPFFLESFADRRTFERDEAIQLFFHPQKLDKAIFVAIENQFGALTYMSLLRHETAENFTMQDIERLRALVKPVRRALRVRDVVRADRRRAALSAQLLEDGRQPTAWLLIDPRLRVVDCDAAGAHCLESFDGLCRRRGRLATTSNAPGEDTESLHAFILAAQRAPEDRRFYIRPSGAPMLALSCVAFGLGVAACGGVSAILIDRLPRPGAVDFEAFSRYFGLTKGEARFLRAFYESGSVAEAARLLSLSQNTGKSHAASIFAKTGCTSQPNLMKCLMSFV